MKHVALEAGIRIVTFKAPAPNFDLFAAIEAEVRMYRFPPLPEDPRAIQGVFDRMRRKPTVVEPTFKVCRDRIHGPRSRANCRGYRRRDRLLRGSRSTVVVSISELIAPTVVRFEYVGAFPI